MNPRWTFAFALTVAGFLCLSHAAFAQRLSPQEYDRYLDRIEALEKQGKYAEVIPLYLRILPSVDAYFGKNAENTALVYRNFGTAYIQLHQYRKAEPLCQRSLQIYEARLGKDHKEVGRTLNLLGLVYKGTSQYRKAEPLLLRSVQIMEANLGQNHPYVAAALHNLAGLYGEMGQYAKAVPLAQRSVQLAEAAKDQSQLASALHGLGLLYHTMGLYTQAEAVLQRSLRIVEAAGANEPALAYDLLALADLYQDMGKNAKAEPLFLRALRVREATLGKDNPEVAIALHNLATFYTGIGQYAKAEPLLLRSRQILEASHGADHLLIGASLQSLATVYEHLGQDAKVEALLRRSLAIHEANLDKDHPDVALSLHNLAYFYAERQQYAKAEPLYRRSLHIYEARLGKDHPTVAGVLSNLAFLYSDLGQYDKAEPLHQRCLEIRQAQLGKEHPRVADAFFGLAVNAAGRKDWPRTLQYTQDYRQATAKYLATVLPALSEQEQLALLQGNFERGLYRALALGWTAPKELSAASAEWLLNGKALAHQSLAEQLLLTRDAKGPEARRLAGGLQQSRARLAALVNRLPKPGFEAEYRQELQDLQAAEQDLAQKLARAVGRPYRASNWVQLDELRARLGPKTAFVDIARFPIYDYSANKLLPAHYVVWVTPPQGKGEVRLIDLGEAEAIDRLVEQTRKTLLESARSVTKVGEVEAAEALRKPMQELSAKVLFPLLPVLQDYSEWVVCPDGALWLAPWNALLLPKGQFAVEKYLIRHAVSGRDLVQELPGSKAEGAYVFADPDYDLSPGKVLTASGGHRGTFEASLLGQRLSGAIGTWKVSFEFRDGEVLIRDEDGGGAVAGKGTWKQQDNALTIRTSLAVFQGTIEANGIRGQRSKRNDDGTVTRDTFRMEAPGGEVHELRSPGAALGTLPKVPRLPGTAAEAEAVRPKIQQWLGQDPKIFLEAQASEAMLKTIKNPRVLTLATHGYFLPTQEVPQKDQHGLEPGEGKRAAELFDKKGQPIENPLLRCGLLLAGCNKRAEAKAGEDDGILTGLEIVGLDLRGCELVVLSACETGLGEVRNGEGVAGLRQAFQLAGAKAVLASLWQVPDRETALLMNAFYGELAKGRSQAEALRQAQLQRIAARRGQFGAAHPFFWSAFALTSRGTD